MNHPVLQPVKVVLVDDHAVVRQGMHAFFATQDDIEVVGEAGDGAALLKLLDRLNAFDQLPAVVILDLQMPGLSGVEIIARIRTAFPTIATLVLTSFGDAARARQVIEAGANGYLLKDAGADELVAAVRSVAAGEMPVDPAVTSALSKSWQAGTQVDLITTREQTIVGLVAQGLSNQEIASALSISERTARTHVSNILAKLGLSSRTQVVLWALEAGLATLGDTGT